ncbi:MAG: type II toxin-antitoxin system HicB family antitoxin [Veillonella sp.]|jgi:hypothetical protein|uniref:type II toxin-antitoxin system HicB family antitoxin n=1 Tax=Bacillota TaxID=1239 RepID=UPI00189C00F6|nr:MULTISPECIES: type II toxin-antitoxin system HicB family antitoxin [Bacillota]MBS5308892.1 type II toxin-antitoxin system HicB family antitoxin [Clostridium sp.]MDU4713056.1 type II toxin-antitoxin system HicB family antitoxin [Veillonella sp.]
MRVKLYPAIFSSDGNNGYTVTFPDLIGCVTEGDTLEEAVKMAEDALGIYLYTLSEEGEPFPEATNPINLKCAKDEFINIVTWDEKEYLKKTDNKAIKKTLTIPSWLNYKAEEHKINFSQVLQKALKKELDLLEQH